MTIFVLFLVYGILGWLLDSGYRSLTEWKWTAGNVLKPIPFSPIYSVGAYITLWIHALIHQFPWFIQAFMFGTILAFYEVLSGHLSEYIFKKRFWKYNDGKGFISGYTDGVHVALWGLLGTVFVYWIHPWIIRQLEQMPL